MIEITGLKLKTANGKKVKLTLEEARELHAQLDEMFGVKKVVNNYSTYPAWPYYRSPNWYTTWHAGTGTSKNLTTTVASSTGDDVVVSNNLATFLSNTTGMKLEYEFERQD